MPGDRVRGKRRRRTLPVRLDEVTAGLLQGLAWAERTTPAAVAERHFTAGLRRRVLGLDAATRGRLVADHPVLAAVLR